MAKRKSRYTGGTSLTDCLERSWEYLADSIIRENLSLTDDEIAAIIRKQGGCKDAAWVRSRRPMFARLARAQSTS